MKTDEIRQLSVDELEHKLVSLKEELFKLRFQAKSGKIEKPSQIKIVKRSIARVLTIQREGKNNAK